MYQEDDSHHPSKPREASGGDSATLSGKIQYYLIDLQILTPLLLIGFAIATLVFIIVDAVQENYDRKSENVFNAVIDLSAATVQVGQRISIDPVVGAAEIAPIIRELMANPELAGFKSQLQAAGVDAVTHNSNRAMMTLFSIMLALLPDLDARTDTLDARGGLYFALLKNVHLSQEVAADLMQMGEGTPTSQRGIQAAGTNLMCAPFISQFMQTFFPTAQSAIKCDSVAQAQVLAASGVDITLDPNDYTGIKPEMDDIANDYLTILEAIRDEYLSSFSSRRGYTKRITILSIAFVLSSIGAALSILLVLSQYRSLHEQSVVESDFDCNAQRVKIHSTTLRTVDEIASRVGVMGSLPENMLAIEAGGNQIEFHLRRAVEPLEMLRPFVPSYMYLRHLRSLSMLSRSTSALLRNAEMLNLQVGLKKKPVALLFVGLRMFNKPDADLELLNELLGAIHLACSHFQGNVVQVSSDGILAIFSRATVNEDEGNERVEDGEVLAVHAAMTVCEICSAPLTKPDGTVRKPFAVSMAVMHSISYNGVMSYHVSKSFALLSQAVQHALMVEPLNDTHASSILTSSSTNDLISDSFITRPVHYVPGVGSVYHVMEAVPSDDVPNRDQVIKDQAKLKEKTSSWCKVWEKHETLVSTDKPTYEMLEDAYRDLEGYKVFQMQANETDVAYQLALGNVKRIAQHLGVSLGATVEEE